ncbi:zinc finger MYM-type protein 1-like [Hyperolius riggenbachi]|uniref:zinc finger MYM-type protein 1-like n=1 Tax=Hyperolius riggenbachi TaxID=752182 RepID=UPI0035A33ADC
MKGAQKKKLSGAEGRRRRKVQAEECAKSSKILSAFLNRGSDLEQSTSKSVGDVGRHTSQDSTVTLEQENLEETNSSESESTQPDVVETESQSSSNSAELDVSPDPVKQTPECTQIIADVIQHQDFGYIKFDQASGKPTVSDSLRIEIVEKGSIFFQNSVGPFSPKKNRSMTSAWFTKQLGKGKGGTVSRSWLLYSPLKAIAFCFSCMLFPSKDVVSNRSSLETENGFRIWKKPEKITAHENSQRHRDSFTTWKEMERRMIRKEGFIDAQLQRQIATEKEKWRQVLTRVLCCIKYLAKQNLALRGHRETTVENRESRKNPGNFIELLKLVADFDPVMKSHLSYVQQHPGSPTYLSPEIQNEFIQLLATTVKEKIVHDIQRAKYYGIMFDSTPDVAHQEQMSETIRYVDVNFEAKTVVVRESFLGFIQAHKKDAASIANIILQQLEKDKLPFEDCRSQCYDNAAVMSGYKSGVQQRLAAINSKATFVNCDNHTLNLVGVHAVSHEVAGVTFFCTVQAIYLYFSRSTLRWERLRTALGVSLKSESETRWSARVEAVKPIHDQLEDLVELLEDIAEDHDENSETRSDAVQLLHRILTFEFLVLLRFWNTILAKIDRVQKRLQDHTMNFHNAAQDIQALQVYFLENSDDICNISLAEAKKLCSSCNVQVERRPRKKKKMAGETAEDVGLTAEKEMLRLMKSMIDKIHTEMGDRFNSLKKLDSSFGFLLDIKELMCTTDESTLKQRCIDMGSFYDTDLDGLEMFSEILDCQMLLNTRADVKLLTPEDLLRFIVQYGDDVFPNLRVGLQILLTVATSIASCERSFSKLKLIMSYLRSSMGQERLSALALLSVEREVTDSINFEEIIDRFAAAKARKIAL